MPYRRLPNTDLARLHALQNAIQRAQGADYTEQVIPYKTLSEAQRKALRIDSLHYDQILGRDLVCYFDSGKVSRLDMSGNVQIIYYPEEKDKTLIGLNQMIGNYLTVWFKNQKMEKLKLWPQVVGSLTPIQLVTDDILYLENFRWMAYLRPAGPKDVFRGIEMKKEDIIEIPRLFNDDELNGY